jgi:hypothetical protein
MLQQPTVINQSANSNTSIRSVASLLLIYEYKPLMSHTGLWRTDSANTYLRSRARPSDICQRFWTLPWPASSWFRRSHFKRALGFCSRYIVYFYLLST